MNQNSTILEDFHRIAQQVLPEGSQVWLYGSRARGDNREDSDWDILILVDKDKVGSADEDEFSYPFVLQGWHRSIAVSPLLYTYKEWQRRQNTPFYHNVEQDKIRIA